MVVEAAIRRCSTKKKLVLKLVMCLVYALNFEKREHLLKTASGSDKVTTKNIPKASSAPCQTSEMDLFARTFNRLELLTILADTYIKNATTDV